MITLKRLAVASYKGIRALDLTFPERGSILIEGRNEAGKSTLFDAVHYALYGVPMVGDLGAALHYGAEQMEVRLELAVSGTQLHAWRRTRQTAKSLRSEAGLSIIPPGGEDPEEVKGTSPVTQRLQLELGGLTAEALLNSCLVAQKQLGRLETLTRASREEALTILLNLGKLSDVQGRLRPRAQDEDALRAARARVSLARTQEALGVLAQEREALQRRRGHVRLRDGLAHLEQLDASAAAARQTLAQHQQGLVRVREARSRLESCKTARARWQRAQEVALQGTAALRELESATRQVAAAGEAGAALPGAREALDRARQARDDAEALVAHQGRLRELAQEGQRLEARLEERARAAERAQRLEQELVRLRGERQQAVDALNALAPLATEQEQLAQRLAALQALQARGGQLQSGRQTVEDLQEQGVTRAEADARHAAARRALDAARAALAGAEERRRWREVALALRRWRAARVAADQAARERRLLDDLALSVAGVEHVALPLLPGSGAAAGAAKGTDESGGTGLRLSLLIDHPLTGVQVVRLRLWAGGAELLEARPATAAESSGLEAGHLPRLDASAGDNSEAELE
ncbi:MAG TPA: AAA family ATPase, partial [Chloroflexota bacterium]|nr:AAA family ATPase [Chloroflexota bacterium]